jgi:hypothetical protein
MVSGTVAAIADLGRTMARHAASVLTFAEAEDAPISRVERGLEVQARAAAWQPARYRVEARALSSPDMSAPQLAALMDAAERASLPAPVAPIARTRPVDDQPPVPQVHTPRPRVAGWIKRARPNRPDEHVAESTARIIERSLKAEI